MKQKGQMSINSTILKGIPILKVKLSEEEYKKYRENKDRYQDSHFFHPLTGDPLAEPYKEFCYAAKN